MVNQNNTNGMPVVQNVEDFDKKSGGLFERLIFSHRVLVILCCLAATLVLGFFASRIEVNASFERMIPVNNPYIQNYLDHNLSYFSAFSPCLFFLVMWIFE